MKRNLNYWFAISWNKKNLRKVYEQDHLSGVFYHSCLEVTQIRIDAMIGGDENVALDYIKHQKKEED